MIRIAFRSSIARTHRIWLVSWLLRIMVMKRKK